MTNEMFVKQLRKIAIDYTTLYIMGCFGSPLNNSNKIRYTQNHSYNTSEARKKMIMTASSNTFGFDCVGLIKGVLWGWNGDINHAYGGAKYGSNNVPDINANSMIKVCTDVTTNFNKIDVGEAVWLSGHIGIYVGDGEVIECSPKWKNCVQITKLRDRTWKKHGRLPYVEYIGYTPTKSNSLTQIATEVIQGKYGNGVDRKQKLEALGYNYKEVQAEVNRLLKK